MFGIGVPELVVIFVIILVLFGGKNLPELSKNVGTAIKEIRKGFSSDLNEKESSKTKKSKE
jgi:sec-independent protein translocase protein TatA